MAQRVVSAPTHHTPCQPQPAKVRTLHLHACLRCTGDTARAGISLRCKWSSHLPPSRGAAARRMGAC